MPEPVYRCSRFPVRQTLDSQDTHRLAKGNFYVLRGMRNTSDAWFKLLQPLRSEFERAFGVKEQRDPGFPDGDYSYRHRRARYHVRGSADTKKRRRPGP